MEGYVNLLFHFFITILNSLLDTMLFKFVIMSVISLGCIYVVFGWLYRIK